MDVDRGPCRLIPCLPFPLLTLGREMATRLGGFFSSSGAGMD
jgi:hypothetical protein